MTPGTTPTAPATAGAVSVAALRDMAAIHEAVALFDAVWQAADVMPANLVRAIQTAGGYVSGAYVDGRMVGASVAFRGTVADGDVTRSSLHSHITGVLHPSSGIGARLKADQMEWARREGVDVITWTFDPLVSRNAYFNLHKLGAHGHRYLVDHYGPMRDTINAGDQTDRLEAWWPTDPARRPATPPADRVPRMVLVADDDGLPHAADDVPTDGRPVGLQIPADVESLRRRSPEIAARWRRAVRDHMAPLIAQGYAATDMRRDGTYLLTRGPRHDA